MCGICGFTNANSAQAGTLKAMCDIMAHRGPDGEGQYIKEGIALGHRRLSLIDLEGGSQPLVLERENTTYAIVFNGEIYNYRDLRAELENAGFCFKTNSDTEVLLVSYIAWGEDMLNRLRGMFAFAIWNERTQELFCARDFFGIKPFYYTVQEITGGEGDVAGAGAAAEAAADTAGATHTSASTSPTKQFIFASEIKSILKHPAYKREVNEAALEQYLCFQFSALDETFFKGIFKLPPAHSLRVFPDGKLEMKRYWRPEYKQDNTRTQTETAQAIDDVMRDSVRYHNVADVEVGSFLSSGIDSSYMAACLAKENPEIKTFTVGFECYKQASAENETGDGGKTMRDEISWARELANLLDIENDYHYISEEEYWESLERVCWHMDEPSADPSAVALYFVDKLAAKRVKAVLSGEGADEFFGGYKIYQVPFANKKLSWVPKPLLRASSKVARKLGIRGANYLKRASEGVADWYYTNANGVAFSVSEREDLRKGKRSSTDSIPSPQSLCAPVYAEVEGLDETTRMQYLDLYFWLVGDILLKTDKMAMAHSLESRVPFLDKRVFELSATIPVCYKTNESQTKITLRQAAEYAIPASWAQKEKLGFPVPVVKWLREDTYYNQVKTCFESEAAKKFFNIEKLVALLDEHRAGADRSRKIWIVYMFLLWHKIFFEDEEENVLG